MDGRLATIERDDHQEILSRDRIELAPSPKTQETPKQQSDTDDSQRPKADNKASKRDELDYELYGIDKHESGDSLISFGSPCGADGMD